MHPRLLLSQVARVIATTTTTSYFFPPFERVAIGLDNYNPIPVVQMILLKNKLNNRLFNSTSYPSEQPGSPAGCSGRFRGPYIATCLNKRVMSTHLICSIMGLLRVRVKNGSVYDLLSLILVVQGEI